MCFFYQRFGILVLRIDDAALRMDAEEVGRGSSLGSLAYDTDESEETICNRR